MTRMTFSLASIFAVCLCVSAIAQPMPQPEGGEFSDEPLLFPSTSPYPTDVPEPLIPPSVSVGEECSPFHMVPVPGMGEGMSPFPVVRESRFRLHWKDGSILVGEIGSDAEVTVETKYGVVRIPLKDVTRVDPAGGKDFLQVTTSNSDRVSGKVDFQGAKLLTTWKEIPLKADGLIALESGKLCRQSIRPCPDMPHVKSKKRVWFEATAPRHMKKTPTTSFSEIPAPHAMWAPELEDFGPARVGENPHPTYYPVPASFTPFGIVR